MSRGHFLRRASRKVRLQAAGPARPQLERGPIAHDAAPLVRVIARQQLIQRHATEVGVAVPGLAVGESELCALGDKVDVLGGEKAGSAQVIGLEQAQLLQEDWALAPRAALDNGPAMEVGGDGWLVMSLETGEVLAGDQSSMRRP